MSLKPLADVDRGGPRRQSETTLKKASHDADKVGGARRQSGASPGKTGRDGNADAPCIYVTSAYDHDDGRLRGTTTSSTHLVKPPDSQMMHRAAVYRLSSQARARGAGRKVARKHRPRPSESGSEVESDVSVTLHGWNRQSSDVMEAMAEADFASEDDDDDGWRAAPAAAGGDARSYWAVCRASRVVPASCFVKSLGSTEVVMKHRLLTAAGLKACSVALLNNLTVKKIDLQANEIGNLGASYIAQLMSENTTITDLTLSDNNIGSEGLRTLTDVLRVNHRLTRLDLSGNGFNDNDARQIADLLEDNSALLELYLSHNRFSEKGGELLEDAIVYNDTLKVLDLSWNHLRYKGAEAISDGLALNTGLVRLNLAWNGFAMIGCESMSRALITNTTLRHLDLSWNRVDQTCLQRLLIGVKQNASLTHLALGGNPLSTEGAITILQAIESCNTVAIQHLDLSGQCVDSTFAELVAKIRATRPLEVKHGLLRTQARNDNTRREQQFIDEDPMTVLMEFMRIQNLRLVDLFASLDKDGSRSLTRQEFRHGLKQSNIPLSDRSLDHLIDTLDKDGDGEVDFKELLEGQKVHKKRVFRMKENERGVPFEITEIGRINAKIRAFLAFRLAHQLRLPPGGRALSRPVSAVRRSRSPSPAPAAALLLAAVSNARPKSAA